MLLWGERRDQGGDSPTAEMQRGPCHPRNDPLSQGFLNQSWHLLSPEKQQLTLPAALPGGRCVFGYMGSASCPLLEIPALSGGLHCCCFQNTWFWGQVPMGNLGAVPSLPQAVQAPADPTFACTHLLSHNLGPTTVPLQMLQHSLKQLKVLQDQRSESHPQECRRVV